MIEFIFRMITIITTRVIALNGYRRKQTIRPRIHNLEKKTLDGKEYLFLEGTHMSLPLEEWLSFQKWIEPISNEAKQIFKQNTT